MNTGYSHGSEYCTSEKCVASDFYTFFVGFLQKHPEFVKRPFYIIGESYAGHYVPAITSYFLN